MNEKLTKLTHKKELMLEALKKSLGIVTTACQNVGISRVTHYEWLNTDPEYKRQVVALDDVVLDFAESKLHQSINNGSDTATIFFLKTKGKKRGYIEKQEITQTNVNIDTNTEIDMNKIIEIQTKLNKIVSE